MLFIALYVTNLRTLISLAFLTMRPPLWSSGQSSWLQIFSFFILCYKVVYDNIIYKYKYAKDEWKLV
jgi:hypothetical protein